ncbi:MAG: tRNA uridine-5-carboxymethylaminomethyl(34) synthesis enzyme MnmG [Chlamydiales bacterium]
MSKCPNYAVIVIGGGHAGCEAAHASARMGVSTLLITMNLDNIAKMSCNPAIGGTAKGHIVREIDALGGIMGKIADRSAIQYRMLNRSKGPAVWSPRAQCDKLLYQLEMKKYLEGVPNLDLLQGTIDNLLIDSNKVIGIRTTEGITLSCKVIIISAGTFMRGLMHIGNTNFAGGRSGDSPSLGLSITLKNLGFKLGRLKTGTPPRIHKKSIDFTSLSKQISEEEVSFSFDDPEPRLPQINCYVTYTNADTHRIIRENLHLSPLYTGKIEGLGPRYCPSLEDKIVKFPDRPRHQIFLEPEGLHTQEYYVNGISTCLPFSTQYEFLRTIEGLESAIITRPAYAIEYDYLISGQLTSSLESKHIDGLFFAGQVNGTTGYEEAAGQGLIAGINSARKIVDKPPLELKRSESYIGVMLDELFTKELDEPYRMFTSRAEYRLLLRQDNADLRLRAYGYQMGIIDEVQYKKVIDKQKKIDFITNFVKTTHKRGIDRRTTLAQGLCSGSTSYSILRAEYPILPEVDAEVYKQVTISIQYAGYLQKEEEQIQRCKHLEQTTIPMNFSYQNIQGMRNEAKERFQKHRPHTLGTASRLSGISPADISILIVALKKHSNAPTTSTKSL